MTLAGYAVRLVSDVLLWAHRSGRLWLPLALPIVVVAAILVASSKAAVVTFVYTLF